MDDEERTITDITEYRELRKQIAEYEDALAELSKLRNEFETKTFALIETGDHKDIEEFRFEAKVGPRGLSPKAGFESTWFNLVADCPVPEEKVKLDKLVTSKMVFKGPTLAQLEKALPESEFLREYYEETKKIFGYKDGSRREVVTVLDAVDPSTLN